MRLEQRAGDELQFTRGEQMIRASAIFGATGLGESGLQLQEDKERAGAGSEPAILRRERLLRELPRATGELRALGRGGEAGLGIGSGTDPARLVQE